MKVKSKNKLAVFMLMKPWVCKVIDHNVLKDAYLCQLWQKGLMIELLVALMMFQFGLETLTTSWFMRNVEWWLQKLWSFQHSCICLLQSVFIIDSSGQYMFMLNHYVQIQYSIWSCKWISNHQTYDKKVKEVGLKWNIILLYNEMIIRSLSIR